MELNHGEVTGNYGPVSELYLEACGKLNHCNMERHFVKKTAGSLTVRVLLTSERLEFPIQFPEFYILL